MCDDQNRISTRLMYDKCAYDQRLGENKSSLDYTLYDGKFYHSNKCRMELGQVGGNGVSLFAGNLVDLESKLKGIQRSNSKCQKPLLPLNNSTLTPQSSCQMVNYSQTVVPKNSRLDYCGWTKPN